MPRLGEPPVMHVRPWAGDRRRRGLLACVVVLAVLPADVTAQTAAEMAESGARVREALEARDSGDLNGYLSGLEDAESLRPGHPELLYLIAGARSLLGDAAGALAALERIADMGLALVPDDDPDFAALRQDPRYAALSTRLDDNGKPRGRSRTAFVIPGEPDFIPEGLAHDARDGSFYVGSVHRRKILRVDSAGVVDAFVRPGTGGLMSAMGMFVDPREDVLWVATAGVPETGGLAVAQRGRSAVFQFDLKTGDPRVTFHFSNREEERVVGDLVRADDGDVYASDARGSGIYRIRAGGDFLETFVQPGVFRSPQGMAVSEDGRSLYVADYSKGVFRVHRMTREAVRLPHPPDVTLLGIDGLVRHRQTLIAIQNGTSPHRILRLDLGTDGSAIRSVEILASNLPEWDEPTLGLVVGDRFYYVANSQWNRFVDGALPPSGDLADPRIMWLDLR